MYAKQVLYNYIFIFEYLNLIQNYSSKVILKIFIMGKEFDFEFSRTNTFLLLISTCQSNHPIYMTVLVPKV